MKKTFDQDTMARMTGSDNAAATLKVEAETARADIRRRQVDEAASLLAADGLAVIMDAINDAYFLTTAHNPTGEDAITDSPMRSFYHARDTVGGPWPPGEAAIANSAEWSFRYAADVVGGPWPPGEAAIATSPAWAYRYAREIVGGPWPPGEAAIATSPVWAARYRELTSQ